MLRPGGIPVLGQDKHLLTLGATAGTPGPGTGASDRRDPIRPPPPASTLPEAKGPPASIQESADRAYPEAHSLWTDRIPPPLKTLPWLPHLTEHKPGVSRSPHRPTRTQGLCAGSSCTDTHAAHTPAGPELLVATHQAGGGLAWPPSGKRPQYRPRLSVRLVKEKGPDRLHLLCLTLPSLGICCFLVNTEKPQEPGAQGHRM